MRVYSCWLLCLSTLLASSPVTAQIISTFDTDAEGWTAIDNLTGPDPTYVTLGGNPGGFIQVVDGVGGTATYFVAPAKFLGDRSASFGQLLRFDLQVSVIANSSTAGVRLTGGGITLVKLLTPEFSLPIVAPGWSSYAFRLDESTAWRVTSTTGPLATNTQIQAALASLTELAINGEYSTVGADGGGLDNVVLEEGNTPPIIVYNAVSPNGDEKNEILFIQFIDASPLTQQNRVSIYNRWGDLVFETRNYDNDMRAFSGRSTDGKALPAGTYFYRIEFESGLESKTGFLSLRQ